ncbi:MAG TPA: nicotinate-nucleotide--dimethylbenzimidazole phosphoribosyltransferase, partial [Firmicutes bacterium]|nr:nicotinate-nucleotide--dimethylbenzimidazole phosphoribosyltransferase [Bacillota bacterium]
DAVRAALQMNKPDPRDGLDVLAKVGGFELGGLAGVMLGAAAMRSMVVVDGFNAGAAAMVAQALQPGCGQYLLGSHISAEEGHRGMIQVLGLHPCIDLGLRLGEAVGASLVANFLDAAIKLLHEMATFEDANVTKSAEE